MGKKKAWAARKKKDPTLAPTRPDCIVPLCHVYSKLLLRGDMKIEIEIGAPGAYERANKCTNM